MKRAKKGELDRRVTLIAGISVLALALLVTLIVFKPGVGQAYRSEAAVQEDTQSADAVYFEYGKGYASQGDEVKIPLRIRAVAGHQIRTIQFCLRFPWSKFSVDAITITDSNYDLLSPRDVSTWFTAANGGVDAGSCPNDYSKKIDVAVSASGTALTGSAQIGEIVLTVDGEVSANNNGETIDLKTVYLGYPGGNEDSSQKDSSTNVVIVPTCPDADGDGFPTNNGVQADLTVGSDYRSCPAHDAVTAVTQFDCDDNDNSVRPGAVEICDGKDNDCQGGADNEMHASAPNDVQLGVCQGRKFCQSLDGDTTLVNSYQLQRNSQETALGDSLDGGNLDNFKGDASFLKGAERIFNFDVYETDETICDGLDNDCDGDIDEDLVNCNPGKSLTGTPPGNIYIEYNDDGTLQEPQDLQNQDRWLFNRLKFVVGRASLTCGNENQEACSSSWMDGTDIYFCRNGIFWEQLDEVWSKRSPFGVRETENPVNEAGAVITC